MINFQKTHWLVPLLALGLTVVLIASVHAQERQGQGRGGVSATLRIQFGSAPHWTNVSGTQVDEIREGERPDYDLFRYQGNYYAYNNSRWYTSTNDRGNFTMIDDRGVPGELTRVPRDHWRNYPQSWVTADPGRDYQRPDGGAAYQAPDRASARLQVRFGAPPRWANINGTRVDEIRGTEHPDYDLFRFNGNYYAHDNDRWYTSNAEQGDFMVIDDRSVPSELSGVPREHWRHYPQAWGDAGRDPYGRGPGGPSATLQVDFGYDARWWPVRGTRVREIRGGDRPDFDLFRYGNAFYAYDNDQWYMSRRPRGEFRAIDRRFVPSELSRVPRDHWRNYPSGWMDQRRDPRWGDHDRRDGERGGTSDSRDH